MDSQSTYDDLPWELIVSALQGELSPDEDGRLAQWLASSSANREKYHRLQQVWKEDMADYVIYQDANEDEAWKALRGKMNARATAITPPFGRRTISIKRWTAAAAILLLLAGAGWWYISGRETTIRYETAADQQKKIPLPDGSTVTLHPQTHIELTGSYNKTDRTVKLVSGEAYFDVSHQELRPFIVDMDAASVKDIGTSFTIEKTKDSIKVIVSGGKIAFIKKATGEVREISAGGSICLYTTTERQGEIRQTNDNTDSLRFVNASLSEVIAVLQKHYGKKILLKDTAIAQKRLTVHFGGESFDDVVKIICFTLDLESVVENGAYVLKNKSSH